MNYTEKMKGHWGLFGHYISLIQNDPAKPNSFGKQTSWEECVNEVNVDLLAEQIASTGASWYGITIHQQNENFICPNAVFEELTGLPRGTATVHRDLPMELGLALKKRGVDLMLYHTGEGPTLNRQATDALGGNGIDKGEPLPETYYDNWLRVLAEDARRYGDLVRAWWVDGCYPGLGYTEKRLLKVSDTLHKYNPDAAVAMNYYGCAKNYYDLDGIIHADWFVDPAPAVPGDDFAAGETNILGGFPCGWSKVNLQGSVPVNDKAIWHLLAFLGRPSNSAMVYDGWGSPGCKYDEGWLKQYRAQLIAAGGALTLDCCIRRDGTLDPETLALLRRIAD